MLCIRDIVNKAETTDGDVNGTKEATVDQRNCAPVGKLMHRIWSCPATPLSDARGRDGATLPGPPGVPWYLPDPERRTTTRPVSRPGRPW